MNSLFPSLAAEAVSIFERAPVTFNFQNFPVRVIQKENYAWFFVSDVAVVLSYKQAISLIRFLDEDELPADVIDKAAFNERFKRLKPYTNSRDSLNKARLLFAEELGAGWHMVKVDRNNHWLEIWEIKRNAMNAEPGQYKITLGQEGALVSIERTPNDVHSQSLYPMHKTASADVFSFQKQS